MTAVGIILAAGKSRRMGQDKALLLGHRRSFLEELATSLRGGGCGDVVIVVREGSGPVAALAKRLDVPYVVNEGGGTGQLDSLRAALRHFAGDPTWGCCVFSPVDCPLAGPELIESLIGAVGNQGTAIALPTFGAKRGHPVCVARSVVQELMTDPLPEGARTVIRSDPHRVEEIPVSDPRLISDIDTPVQYAAVFNQQPRATS